ncbi:NADH-quinone oxidoreductase subunit C [Infirmifilum lucidum]|nr:NADH-quinone oxidoreductase subunit C [Infirmifilum lucidum]
MSGVELASLVEQRLRERGFEAQAVRSVVKVKATPERLRELAEEVLRMGFDHLASIEGIDWPQDGVIEVVYHAESYREDLRGVLVEIRVRAPRDTPRLPSLIDVWPNAILLERETWEMLGVVFEGNPDLRQLLLPPDWSGPPPLRKDFKVVEEGVYVDVE